MDKLEADKKFLFKGTIYNLFGTLLKGATPLLTILTARIFGAEEFGIFVSAQLYVLTLSRVSVFGLDKGLNWYLPQNQVHNRPVITGFISSLNRSALIALIITLSLFVCIIFDLNKHIASLAGLSSIDIAIYAMSLIPWVILHIFGGASEGMRKPQYKIFISDCSVTAISPLVAICLYYFAELPHALPVGLLCANILGCLIYLPLLKKIFNGEKNPNEKLPRELFLYSIPRGFSEIIASVLFRIDLWLVLLLLGPAESGVYAVMLMISNGLRTITQGFGSVLLPVVANMDKGRLNSDLKQVFSYSVSVVISLQLIAGFFIILFPEEILMIAGKEFVIQPQTLSVLLFANLVGSFFGMAGGILYGTGKSFYMLKVDIAAFCVAFTANYLLIPIWGLVGAALSTFAFLSFQAICFNIRVFKMHLFPYSAKLLFYMAWILILTISYFLLFEFSPTIPQKIIIYLLALSGIGITFKATNKKK
jgi:O-antigen/teichoic acid export membrane protein